MTLLELAERVEKAEGSDRELDCRIWCLIDGVVPFDEAVRVVPDFGQWIAPAYTASLDAALSLVPENHAVDLTMWGPLWDGKHRARVLPLVRDGDRWLHRGCDPDFCVNAATPALALCAAALRARAAQ